MKQAFLNIAIIDDGINEQLFNTDELIYNMEVTPELEILARTEYDPLKKSHGTICAAIIKKYSPSACLSSIKILSDLTRKGACDQLVQAIDWCTRNGIRLANLSLGSIDYKDYDKIKDCVNRAYENGLIIVAACSNNNVVTYPASLTNVIGVRCDRFNEGEYIFNAYAADGIDISSCGIHTLTDCFGNEIKTPISNSCAAPMITAFVHRLMEQKPDITLEEIKARLYENSIHSSHNKYNPNFSNRIDWIENAFVFEIYNSFNSLENIKYLFSTTEIFKIECERVQGGLENVIDILKDKRESMEIVKVIVAVICFKVTAGEEIFIHTFLDEIEKIGKAVALFYDTQEITGNDFEMLKRKARFCLPYFEKHSGCLSTHINYTDIPIIQICDFTGKNTCYITAGLMGYFRNDGYYAVAVVDTALGAVAGLGYMTAANSDTCAKDVIGHLYRMYNPDIVLFGHSAKDYRNSDVNDSFKADIKLLIVDEFEDLNGFSVQNSSNSETIVLAMSDRGGISENTTVKLFYIDNKECLKAVYDYILLLFAREV